MSDIVKAREAATAAETRVEYTLDAVLSRLHAYNSRLAELHDDIRKAQPVSSGSVCLELYPCGTGCRGCPHARWVQYKWTNPKDGRPGIMLGINLDAQKREPILALSRKHKGYLETSTLIREAKTILKERANVLASIRALANAAKLR